MRCDAVTATNMTYPKLQKVKRIIGYPFRLIVLLFLAPIGFVATDFNDRNSVEYYLGELRSLYIL